MLRKLINRSCKNRLLEPTLDYGDILFVHTTATTLKPLDAMYHSAIHQSR